MKKVSTIAVAQSRNISQQKLTIGLDLGDRNSWYCVLDEAGQIQLEQRVRTTARALQEVFGALPRSRIALEIGTHSPWISRLLSELGHEVIVANARKVRLIGESRKKDDRLDAQTLARLARIDPQLLSPVRHRSAKAQADLTVIRARAGLVRARTALVNTARGLAKSYGERLRGCNVRNMNPEKAEGLSPELQRALQPLLVALESLSQQIAAYNQRIEQLAQQSYPQVAVLKQIKGVGTLIALTFLRRWKTRIASARVATSAVIWDCSRGGETLGRANRRCTSVRKAIRICARCWCRGHSTSWDRLASTATYAAGG
jgi:transposase